MRDRPSELDGLAIISCLVEQNRSVKPESPPKHVAIDLASSKEAYGHYNCGNVMGERFG